MIDTIPDAWIAMAKKYNGIIAGGCLRDLLLQRPIKDVDIFVAGLMQENVKYADGFAVDDVFDAEGTQYQIICHRFGSIEGIIENFDIGLCKLWCEPAPPAPQFNPYVVRLHPDFVRDMVNKTITALRDNGTNHAEHLRRVMQKYPDYRLVPLTNIFDDPFAIDYSAITRAICGS